MHKSRKAEAESLLLALSKAVEGRAETRFEAVSALAQATGLSEDDADAAAQRLWAEGLARFLTVDEIVLTHAGVLAAEEAQRALCRLDQSSSSAWH